MNGKDILELFKDTNFMIPTQESIIKFAEKEGLEIFKEGRGLAYSNKVSLVLDLDTENPGKIKEYFLDDGKGGLYKINDEVIGTKKIFELILDPTNNDLLIDEVDTFKLKITHNSIYDEVIVTINGIGIDMTDYNKI